MGPSVDRSLRRRGSRAALDSPSSASRPPLPPRKNGDRRAPPPCSVGRTLCQIRCDCAVGCGAAGRFATETSRSRLGAIDGSFGVRCGSQRNKAQGAARSNCENSRRHVDRPHEREASPMARAIRCEPRRAPKRASTAAQQPSTMLSPRLRPCPSCPPARSHSPRLDLRGPRRTRRACHRARASRHA